MKNISNKIRDKIDMGSCYSYSNSLWNVLYNSVMQSLCKSESIWNFLEDALRPTCQNLEPVLNEEQDKNYEKYI